MAKLVKENGKCIFGNRKTERLSTKHFNNFMRFCDGKETKKRVVITLEGLEISRNKKKAKMES